MCNLSLLILTFLLISCGGGGNNSTTPEKRTFSLEQIHTIQEKTTDLDLHINRCLEANLIEECAEELGKEVSDYIKYKESLL